MLNIGDILICKTVTYNRFELLNWLNIFRILEIIPGKIFGARFDTFLSSFPVTVKLFYHCEMYIKHLINFFMLKKYKILKIFY